MWKRDKGEPKLEWDNWQMSSWWSQREGRGRLVERSYLKTIAYKYSTIERRHECLQQDR